MQLTDQVIDQLLDEILCGKRYAYYAGGTLCVDHARDASADTICVSIFGGVPTANWFAGLPEYVTLPPKVAEKAFALYLAAKGATAYYKLCRSKYDAAQYAERPEAEQEHIMCPLCGYIGYGESGNCPRCFNTGNIDA